MNTFRVREANPGDVDAVAALQREVRFKTRSAAGWRWLFEDNPARRRYAVAPAQGWVLEDAAGIEGYLGNIPQDYAWEGRAVRAATCTGYVVRPAARAGSLKLLQAWFKQPEVELFLSTTANPDSEDLYAMCRAESPADESFRTGLVWVGADRPALLEQLVERGVDEGAADGLALAGAPFARLVRRLSGYAHVPGSPGVRAVETRDRLAIDERYDALWARISTQPGLRVRRDAPTLRWMLADPDAPPPLLLECSDPDGLAGYAIVARHSPGGGRAPQLRLLDLSVLPGRGDLAAPLLRAAADHARRTGAGLLYAPPCGVELAGQLRGLGATPHLRPHRSHFLRAARREDTVALLVPGTWHATGLDGDIAFCVSARGFARDPTLTG